MTRPAPAEARADLHAHTTASDGSLNPAELVAAARRAGLAAIGVCDHDTLAGLPEAAAAAEAAGIELVPGVEINTDAAGAEIHVLGYYVGPGTALDELLSRLRESRERRGRQMVDQLAAAGAPVRWERVVELAGGAIGRPHVARALVEAGHARDVPQAFKRFLLPGCPGYVPRFKLHPAEAVAAIRNAGGVPVLAHPGLIQADVPALVAELVRAGLRGIEAYYPEHGGAAVRDYLALADRYGLLPTGGSDFHGPGAGRSQLGAATVPVSTVRALSALRGSN